MYTRSESTLYFEQRKRETDAKMQATLKEILARDARLGLPFVYRNHLCTEPNYFIHQYPDGVTQLIERNLTDSSLRIVEVLR